MNIGYTGVLTTQLPDTGTLRLDRVYMDTSQDRPALRACLHALGKEDILHVRNVCSLGRGFADSVRMLNALTRKGVGFCFHDAGTELDPEITPILRVKPDVLDALLDLERKCYSAVMRRHVKAARQRGVRVGRPRLELPEGFAQAFDLWLAGTLSSREAARQCGMAHTSFHTKAEELRKARGLARAAKKRPGRAPRPREASAGERQ